MRINELLTEAVFDNLANEHILIARSNRHISDHHM